MKKICSFNQYLNNNIGNTDKYTHTRIGSKENKIYGGIYNITNNDTFLDNYFDHVFVNNNKEFLTEKQNIENAPLVIDIDMRYNNDINERQHTKEHIVDLINLYLETISKIYLINDKLNIEIFVMEKPTINKSEDKVKDGIHIIIGLSVHKAGQIILRDMILDNLKEIWSDLPLINDKSELIDEGVTRGSVNWQMYGSRKPNNCRYNIKYHFNVMWIELNNEWKFVENNIENFDIKKNLKKLSVHYSDYPSIELKEIYKKLFEDTKDNLIKKKKNKLVIKSETFSNISDIKTINDIDNLINELIDSVDNNILDYEIKETHQYTMLLPATYWDAGSYNKWIRVGWALKNTNQKLLITWLKFSSQSKEFSINDIPELIEKWNSFDYNSDGLTDRSIMYWAKQDNYKEYIKIRNETITYYIEQSLNNVTEWDFARVLHQICKDEFICVSIKNNIWYEYIGHRWYEIDSGNTLRLIISKKMHDMYMKKTTDVVNMLQKMDQTEDNYETLRKRSNKLSDICTLLKKTTWKNNIMREAKELFYDKNFYNKLDNNPYLLCFNNFVIDFKNKIIRNGQPDDYISKSTNIDYIPYSKIVESDSKTIDEINNFIIQLFPDIELRKYMWQHLASTLIGNNENQTFNIYTGSGANGKSKLVDLMSKMLGDYKATVPITLVTQKRNNIGSTSSEIVQLMGIRYAVMQEPSKGERINEGIMKEITGGDPIQGRALFKEAITFIPQFKLVVCTNTLFDIKSNDDGTWRRIRVCDFVSKFLDNPYGDDIKFPKSEYPYQYAIDKHIDEKFERWAPVLASMLVDIAFKNNGNVEDCKIVMASSDQYREGQDYLAEFIKEKIKNVKGGKIKKTELWEVFKQWYNTNYGKGLPKARELNEFMDKRFGKYTNKWSNIIINYDDEDDDED